MLKDLKKSFLNKIKNKNGSNLSQSDICEFLPAEVSEIQLETIFGDCTSTLFFNSVYQVLSTYTTAMKENIRVRKIDEIKFVQPHSFNLLTKLNEICLSSHGEPVNKKKMLWLPSTK